MTAPRRISARMVLTILIVSSLYACGDDERPAGADEEPPTPEAMAAAMEAMAAPPPGSASAAPRPSAEDLGNRLPPTALGIAQTDVRAVSSGRAGSVPTSATARYVDEDGGRMIEIGIIDAGAADGTRTAIAPWATTSFNRRTANGFERTSTFEGFPAFESEEGAENALRSRFEVAAGEYVVQLTGQRVRLDQLRELADDLELSGLGGR